MDNLDSPKSDSSLEKKEELITIDSIFLEGKIHKNNSNRDSLNFELTSSKVSQRSFKRKKTIVEITQIDETREILLKKIIRLNNIFSFSKNIGNFYSQILKKYFDSYYSNLNTFLNNEIKPLIKYFKDLTNIYSNFSLELNKISNILPNQNEELILGQNVIEIVSKANLSFEKYLNELSLSLKKNISSITINKYDNLNLKIDENNKKTFKLIWKIEHRLIKLDNLYVKNFKNVFDTFKEKFNDDNLENELILMNDFIMIEHKLVSYCNKIFIKIEFYLNEILKIIKESNEDFNEYILFMKNNLESFKNQIFLNNDIYLSIDLSEETDFDLEKQSLLNLINKSRDINEIIKQFQHNLIQYDFIKETIIYEDSNFNIKNYETFKEFILFSLKLIPKKIPIEYNDIIQFKAPCLRDAGVFKGWRNCFIIVTIQKHVIIFDEEKDIKDNSFNMNKLFVIYNQNLIVVEKKTSKKSKFIIGISELNQKEKKIKNMQIDAIDEDNRNNIIKAINPLRKISSNSNI